MCVCPGCDLRGGLQHDDRRMYASTNNAYPCNVCVQCFLCTGRNCTEDYSMIVDTKIYLPTTPIHTACVCCVYVLCVCTGRNCIENYSIMVDTNIYICLHLFRQKMCVCNYCVHRPQSRRRTTAQWWLPWRWQECSCVHAQVCVCICACMCTRVLIVRKHLVRRFKLA